ncbi:hypothetical protein KKF91_18485 [Myxococcota bacterium]|nr:hypothetical protein [Myxococcota bacterium]
MKRDRIDQVLKRFERISKRLDPDILTGEEDLEEALLSQLNHEPEARFLGFYSEEGLTRGFEAYGLFDTLRRRGYAALRVEMDLQDFHHTLRVFGDELLLFECRLRRARGCDAAEFAEFQRSFTPELLIIEWLALADPRRDFSPDRPRLPGQTHPGSGVADEAFVLLYLAARRLKLHGLLEIPERFHNAYLYRRDTRFIDPLFEGRFLALQRLLNQHSLCEVAWAMEEGRIINAADGEVIRWAPKPQVFALDERLDAYFQRPAWRRAVAEARQALTPLITPRPGDAPPSPCEQRSLKQRLFSD